MIAAAYVEINDFEKSASFSKKYKHLLDSLDFVKKRSGDVNFINRINQKVSDTNEKISFLKERAFLLTIAVIIILILVAIVHFRRQGKKKNTAEIITPENISTPQIDIVSYEKLQSDVEPDTVKTLVFLAKEDINTFHIEFQKTYPSFYLILKDKYPDLNISDLNFCSLIKMNFSIKEISQFTNSTIRAIEARHQRVYKKMDLKNQDELYRVVSVM
ncbi:helix-turn-helix transcriptional regulator [Epilithonimonas lactis]|uniref:HTH luxR-type domain-containing protein n=1 Tax=Epilithonimonas lactis TaxID=421072 RepID=A0A085BGA7_9FLAO|nr:hypothetical protein [Epilithonimonas lactis]KFC21502.1 hypothetical protein IO89_15115 [Epilithonimonas lactis]SEP87221.1 hypothetical protein SAMN04488097_0929 [Epilithonimonas lactis]